MTTELIVRTSAVIRTLARAGQYGHSRTPRNYYMSQGYCAWYWSCSPFSGVTLPEWDHAAEVLARYHRLVQWAVEVLPGWTDVRTLSYMDNSEEREQVCKCGLHVRRVMVRPPSGDACF